MKTTKRAGKVFGELVCVGLFGVDHLRNSVWICECSCGKQLKVSGAHLTSGHSQSCGHARLLNMQSASTKHGHDRRGRRTRTSNSWHAMKTRCTNASSEDWKDYGGRGIKFCARWSRFESFLQDMGERPSGTSLDRKDVNGNYCKSNCRWATPIQQAQNKRNAQV